jgi:hypothetical protein
MDHSIQNMLDLYKKALNHTGKIFFCDGFKENFKRRVHRRFITFLLSLHHIDPRVRDYPLMWNNPMPVILLVIFYLLFVIIGKRVMRDLPPVNVPSSILIAYNFFLVFLSLYMFEEVIKKTRKIDCRYGITWRGVECAHIYNFLFRSVNFFFIDCDWCQRIRL